jgi:hypothetical protein
MLAGVEGVVAVRELVLQRFVQPTLPVDDCATRRQEQGPKVTFVVYPQYLNPL